VVDPALIDDYRRYRGATLITPNRYEAALASGIKITDQASLEDAARQILLATDAEAAMITLDAEGIFLLTREGEGRRFAARPRTVYDGTGAGDAVLAAVAVAMASGCDFAQAAELANLAGGLEVERFGVVPITRDELIDELHRMIGLRGGKVVLRTQLAEQLARRRARGETVVFTNGCFDLLHMGHVRYLQEARELGSCLVVAINSDDSVQRLKGAGRPVIGQDERAQMLGALECVDYVTIFDEDTPIPLLELLKPEILVKGGTTADVVGREVAEAYGAKVLKLALVEGLSTTKIINKIVAQNETP
jgi:D-beta-D-heptose 7-phosphate kinase/D-beta-D-heptose 1-phosphate adenosyltransferase